MEESQQGVDAGKLILRSLAAPVGMLCCSPCPRRTIRSRLWERLPAAENRFVACVLSGSAMVFVVAAAAREEQK
jgi:hypothetical protein